MKDIEQDNTTKIITQKFYKTLLILPIFTFGLMVDDISTLTVDSFDIFRIKSWQIDIWHYD